MPRLLTIVVRAAVVAAAPARAAEVVLRARHLLPSVAIGHSAMLAPRVEKVERRAGGRSRIDIETPGREAAITDGNER